MHFSSQEALLKALAVAVVHYPRANMYDLGASVGVSKATLYRFAPSRDALIEKIRVHAVQLIHSLIEDSDLSDGDFRAALRRLIVACVKHKEFLTFLMYYGDDLAVDTVEMWKKPTELLDAFFLRGQKSGVFRIDVPAVSLCEMFMGVLWGFVDAERRGRVAPMNVPAEVEALVIGGVVGEPADQLNS